MTEVGTRRVPRGSESADRSGGQAGAGFARARLGSPQQAPAAAGSATPHPLRRESVGRQRCIEAVAAYAAEAAGRGEHPGLVGYEREAPSHGWPSRTTITARLGPWTAALAAAGATPDPFAGPSRDDCIEAVSAYVTEMEVATFYPTARGYRALARGRHWPGVNIAAAHLGSWSDALTAVGFARARKPGQPYVTRDDCVAAIRAYIEEAASNGRYPGTVGYDAVSRHRGWPHRQRTVMARLGSWAAALDAAGFSGLQHQRSQTVSRHDCLAAVRAYASEMSHGARRPTLAGYTQLARIRGWPATSTVLARLGSWGEALKASEIS